FKVKNGLIQEEAICFLVYEEEKDTKSEDRVTAAVRKGGGKPILTSTSSPGRNRPLRGHVVEVPAINVTSDEVVCRLPVDTRPGTPKIGLALHPTTLRALRSKSLDVPSFPLVLKSKPPKVLEAYVEKKVLIVTFDQNVASDSLCQNIFNERKIIGK
ncbi:unnamed protein product, partial [Meganyctiphanes norvegica]